MEVVYMQSDVSPISLELSRQAIKTGVIFSHKMHAVFDFMMLLKGYVDREKMPEHHMINIYSRFYSEHPNAFKKDDLDYYLKALKILRNKSRKSKEELISLGKFEKLFRNVKLDVERGYQIWLEDFKMDSLIGFNENKTLHLHSDKAERAYGEYIFQKTILEEFTTPDFFHFFCTGRINSKENPPLIYDGPKPKTELIFSTRLCLLPCLDSLTYAQLNIIRNEFHEILQPFYKSMIAMKTEFDNIILTPENVDETDKKFDDYVNPYLPFFEDYINNNIYFQQIENSSTSHKTYELSVEFATIKTILYLYRQVGVLSEAEEADMQQKLAHTMDLNTCCVFFLLGEVEG